MEVLAEIGYGNMVSAKYIVAVTGMRSKWARRAYMLAVDENRLLDLTEGRKMRSMIFLATEQVAVSALDPPTLRRRMQKHSVVLGEGDDYTATEDVQ